MVHIYYDDILVGRILTSLSITIDYALEMLNFKETNFCSEYGFDEIDYNEFRMEIVR
jgi:hypothetical protein